MNNQYPCLSLDTVFVELSEALKVWHLAESTCWASDILAEGQKCDIEVTL